MLPRQKAFSHCAVAYVQEQTPSLVESTALHSLHSWLDYRVTSVDFTVQPSHEYSAVIMVFYVHGLAQHGP